MHKELAFIQARPGLRLGADNECFTALCGFITGYEVGFHAGLGAQTSGAADARLVPAGFGRFVTEYYGRKYPDGGRGWQNFVREHADNEQAAFRLFFKLLAEYELRHPGTQ